YRAQVSGVVAPKKFRVTFIDYGNSEVVTIDKLRTLSSKFSTLVLAPQAKNAQLALITVPEMDDDFGLAAYERIREETEGRRLSAKLLNTSGPNGRICQVVLYAEQPVAASSKKAATPSVNEILVREGLATINRALLKARAGGAELSAFKDVLEKLKEAQEVARSSRTGLWQYGDFMDDEA
ncbi:hypothetical protein HK405_000021, partial [Cladochytrium tenue]